MDDSKLVNFNNNYCAVKSNIDTFKHRPAWLLTNNALVHVFKVRA